MKRKTEIVQLGARFHIEQPHVGHVADLAVRIFDGFFPLEGLRRKDRAMLFAAAYLHDIGYADDPENHVEAGTRLLLENPVGGFSPGEWKTIVATALLHRRNWRPVLTHELVASLTEKQLGRALRLAAILRIADGLDHSHIQDARIRYCRREGDVDQVGVECGWYPDNIPWAEGKADLWAEVFDRPVQLVDWSKDSKPVFQGVVKKKDSAEAAARRVLYSQYAVMRDQVPGMLAGRDPECLHDYRVAMRRFRAALRMFRPVLDGTGSRPLEGELGEWSDRLGPIRDHHVLFEFFQRPELSRAVPDAFLRRLEADAMQANRDLAAMIDSEACIRMVKQMTRFLRVDLPMLEQHASALKFRPLAEKRLSGVLKRILKTDVSAVRTDPERMHALRKLCRRGRYYAEFSVPVRGARTQRVAKVLKSLAGVLGDIRDAQLQRARLQDSDCGAPALELLEQLQQEGWKRFSKEWNKLINT
jgi:CHAD domain-containing protein